MVTDRLQHRKHGQIGLAGSGLIHVGIRLHDADDIMRHLVHGILIHFAYVEHCVGQSFIIRELVDVRQQTLDRGQLQILNQFLGGLVGGGSQHQRFGAQPTRRNAFARQAQRIQCATP